MKYQKLALVVVTILGSCIHATQAQNTYTYIGTNGGSWIRSTNWSGGTANKSPGVDANASTISDGATTDIAAFATSSTIVSVGINFNTGSGNGTTANGAANQSLSLGEITLGTGATAGGFLLGNNSTTLGGTLTLNGATGSAMPNVILQNGSSSSLTLANVQGSGNKTMDVALGNAASIIQVNGSGNIVISSNVKDGAAAAGLTINSTGTGAVVLSGTNTYSNGTTVTAGTLLVNNTTGSGTGGGTVAVNGGTLGGSGTISGATTVASGATIQGGAGTAAGALTLSSPLTLNTGSIVQIALGSTLGHSTLATVGASFDPQQTFKFLLGAGTTIGTYAGIITGLTADPGTEGSWVATATDGNFMGTFAYNGGNIDLNVTSVPEPATVIGGVLLIGAAGWSQRRRLRGAFFAA